jgi:hypothetical protein
MSTLPPDRSEIVAHNSVVTIAIIVVFACLEIFLLAAGQNGW